MMGIIAGYLNEAKKLLKKVPDTISLPTAGLLPGRVTGFAVTPYKS